MSVVTGTNADDVYLRVPARRVYAPAIRVAAAAVAARGAMNFNTLEELRSALDKAMAMLLDGLDVAGGPGEANLSTTQISVVLRNSNGSFQMEAERSSGPKVSEAAARTFQETTAGLLDECRVDRAKRTIWLRKAHKGVG
ncbi:MAG: hypothetical protein KTU85_08365 [Acidimicrobiia bacterium]|nr:hypothetical protein [Acidimicrobiia bacterium]